MKALSAHFARPSIWRWSALIAGVAILMMARGVHAAQILINPGDDWEKKAARARPGDEIILMPGRHRPASFERLVGEAGSPIVIRGASSSKPSVIAGSTDGIRVKSAAHLVIKDLEIAGGSASGIWIAGATTSTASDAQDVAAMHARDLIISNVAVSRIGPRGQRHGVFISGFGDVRISNLRVEGWGGAAIELIACEDVTISRCAFRGLEDHSQHFGIRARAGTDRVTITETRFENAGDIALCMGGKSDPAEFVPPLLESSAEASRSEAARVALEQSLIIGSLCPLAYIHATDCLVRSTTIFRPRRCVMALASQNPDPRVRANARNLFGNNLVTWRAGDLTYLVEVDAGVDPQQYILEPNLWWSDDTAEQRAKLGGLPGKPDQLADQLFDVDPKFGQTLRPENPEARTFGAGT